MEEKGKLKYVEIKIGDSYLMLADEDKEWKSKSPKSLGGASGSVFLNIPSAKELYEKCKKLGFKKVLEPTPMPWGDILAMVDCPFGHRFVFR